MIIKNIKINNNRSITLSKSKVKNKLKVGDIVFCSCNEGRFYAKLYKQGRAIRISIPQNAGLVLSVSSIDKLSVSKVKFAATYKKYKEHNTLYVDAFIKNFRDWEIIKKKGKIHILYFRRGTRPLPLSLNNKIELNEKFFEFLGLLEGEMLKYNSRRKGGFRFDFGNSNAFIIQEIIKNLNTYFGIYKDKLTFELRLKNRQDSNRHIIKKWKKYLEIKKIHKIYFYSDLNETSGLFIVRYFSTILAELLCIFLDNLNVLISEKKHMEGFLRGLSAADGSIHRKSRSGTIDSFQIAIKNKAKREFVLQIIKKLGINGIYVTDKYIRVSGFDNFIQLARMNIFKLHDERKERFNKFLEKSQKFRTIVQLSSLHDKFTIKDYMSKTSAVNYPPVYTKLLNYVNSGLLEVTGDGTRNSPLKFSKSQYTKNTMNTINAFQ